MGAMVWGSSCPWRNYLGVIVWRAKVFGGSLRELSGGQLSRGGGFSLNSFLHFKTYHINKIYVDKALLKRFHLTNANKLKAKIYLP